MASLEMQPPLIKVCNCCGLAARQFVSSDIASNPSRLTHGEISAHPEYSRLLFQRSMFGDLASGELTEFNLYCTVHKLDRKFHAGPSCFLAFWNHSFEMARPRDGVWNFMKYSRLPERTSLGSLCSWISKYCKVSFPCQNTYPGRSWGTLSPAALGSF